MPVCIHCATPIESLYMRYGKDHIVLSPCTSSICSSPSNSTSSTSSAAGSQSPVVLADEYLEHDLPIVIIDLILAKPQAYRHLLFNRSTIFTPTSNDALKDDKKENKEFAARNSWGDVATLLKRLVALCLVDAYIRWFYLCVQPPPMRTDGWEMEGGGKVVGLVQRWLPMQAGMFFPSMFTPRGQGEASGAVGRVCSAIPLWTSSNSMTAAGSGAGEMLPTPISYLNILCITLIEATSLHLCVTLLAHLSIPYLSSPYLPSYALLLSQLSPLLLLLFVLLWSSTSPHTPSTTLNKGLLVWIIRTFLSSLNSGIALATCLPPTPQRFAKAYPALILAAAWTAQALTSGLLHTFLE
ncbi:hypothetical protein PHBOTO_001199 [Pseudozyma hubeiensis]|nr:hypothetical protein PHBOTO_001199 [Pseudozyma hubeiensis]